MFVAFVHLDFELEIQATSTLPLLNVTELIKSEGLDFFGEKRWWKELSDQSRLLWLLEPCEFDVFCNLPMVFRWVFERNSVSLKESWSWVDSCVSFRPVPSKKGPICWNFFVLIIAAISRSKKVIFRWFSDYDWLIRSYCWWKKSQTTTWDV